MAEGMFADLKWHHAGFSVNDIDAAIDFYGEVFGMEVESRLEIPQIATKIVFLRRDNFRFELFEKAGSEPVPPHAHTPNTDLSVQGIKHPCFSVVDCQAALETLHAHPGAEIVGIVRKVGAPMVTEDDPSLSGDKEPAKAFFFRDPCGLLVEILRASDFPE